MNTTEITEIESAGVAKMPGTTPPPRPRVTRDIRQRDIIPPARLAASTAMIVGVGAIGRQVAVQLAAMGVPQIIIIDHDTVGVENLAPQGYWPADIGQPKVFTTRDLLFSINPDVVVRAINSRFRRSSAAELLATERFKAVFCCVDSMEARRMIWESVRPYAELFVDGRMSAETLRILAADIPRDDTDYEKTLFTDDEAHVGSCTAKSTGYTAAIAAGLMCGQFTKRLRGMPADRDTSLNLLAMEMVAG